MKCSVHKKTLMCEVQGINSHPVFLMDLDLRPRVWHNEVGIHPLYFMGCQLIPPPWSTAPQRSPGSVGRAAVDGVTFGKVWGPLHGVPQGPSGTRLSPGPPSLQSWALLSQLQGTQLWHPLERGSCHQPCHAQAGTFPMPGIQAWGTLGLPTRQDSTSRRAGRAAGTPLLSTLHWVCGHPSRSTAPDPAAPKIPTVQDTGAPVLSRLQLHSASLQGGCKGKDANSIAHPSRFAPLKIRFGLGTCLCSCTLR